MSHAKFLARVNCIILQWATSHPRTLSKSCWLYHIYEDLHLVTMVVYSNRQIYIDCEPSYPVPEIPPRLYLSCNVRISCDAQCLVCRTQFNKRARCELCDSRRASLKEMDTRCTLWMLIGNKRGLLRELTMYIADLIGQLNVASFA